MTLTNGTNEGIPVEELSREEAKKLLHEVAMRYLGLSADEFVRKWDAGEFQDTDEPAVMRVAMLMPLAA